MYSRLHLFCLLSALSALGAHAQAPAPNAATTTPAPPAATRPAPVVSPEIHPDRSVTFRLRAPAATAVKMWGDWDGKGNDLAKDPTGVWSITLGPLAPNIYAYSFNLDGLTIADPQNPLLKPMRSPTSSALLIPGEPPVPIDYRSAVPHGTVHLHDYDSPTLGVTRRLRVYTPPGYDPAGTARYPVLYLLHGSGDNEATWTEFGRAHLIIDNLIAAGKAQPMIVVMTDGHAITGVSPAARTENTPAFEHDLLSNVIPLIEARYLTRADRDHRAIGGLSMGGNQSLLIGLNHRELFAWVGGMSSAIREPEAPLAAFWQNPNSTREPLRLLWIRVGVDDFLVKENHRFDELLNERKVPHDYAETVGGHTWPVWRGYITQLAPRLFVAQ